MKKQFKYLNLSEIAKKLNITSSNVSSRPSYNTFAILEACDNVVSELFGYDESIDYNFVYNKKIVGRIFWDKQEKKFKGIILGTDHSFEAFNLPRLHERFIELIKTENLCQKLK